MNNKAIGIFDSGLGGLTALKELSKILPNENIIYFGDTGRVPYGTKSRETIIKYAIQDTKFLMSKDVKLIISACGTVSTVSNNVSSHFDIPFIGVVSPTCKTAVNITKNKKIGIIGTTATINSCSYKNEISLMDPSINVFQKDCPLFVPIVEEGIIFKNDKILKLAIKKYLSEFLNIGIDTLILGCTHYPIISEAISKFLGNDISIIDSGKETASHTKIFLKQKGLFNLSNKQGKITYYVSDSVEKFSKTAQLFLEKNIEHQINKVLIEEYN